MPIVSSTFSAGPAQGDGRRHVVERHTDGNAFVHIVEYLASVGAVHNTIMAARAVLLAETLADDEARRVNGSALVLTQQTIPQYLSRLRLSYQPSAGAGTCRIAHRMLKHLADNDCTPAQMRTAWGLSVTDWTAKAANLQLKADKWNNLRSAENAMTSEVGD